MKKSCHFGIKGYAWEVPQCVTSESIEESMSWPKGWAERYSGVKQRHWVCSEESNGSLGAQAARKALDRAGISLEQVDLILFAGATYDYPLPNQASVIKHHLDPNDVHISACIDVDTTCLSFITAFEIAVQKLATGFADTILLVSAEVASRGLNPDSRETYTLFGDAAAAFVLTCGDATTGTLHHSQLRTYSSGVFDTIIKYGGNKYHFKDHPYNVEDYSFYMNGKQLLRLAKKKIPEFFEQFFSSSKMGWANVDVMIPHQASKSGLIMLESIFDFKQMGIEVPTTLANFGNCIAASLPLTMAKALEEGQIKPGHTCVLAGTSAGFSIGAILFTLGSKS
jgi:3-oxoacyl-[acyl-carrier-protein] synthase-3